MGVGVGVVSWEVSGCGIGDGVCVCGGIDGGGDVSDGGGR